MSKKPCVFHDGMELSQACGVFTCGAELRTRSQNSPAGCGGNLWDIYWCMDGCLQCRFLNVASLKLDTFTLNCLGLCPDVKHQF